MGKLFGTDGVRGVANTELTAELAMNIGRAAAAVLAKADAHKPRILIGKDTRRSGDMLETALAAGLCSVGADVFTAGVIPTPAVAYLVQKYGMDAGIMISASHNPYEYNGIKIFSGDGYKLPDSLEDEIEAVIFGETPTPASAESGLIGTVTALEEALPDYVEYLLETTDERFDGMKIALDCANGSASGTAKVVFDMLGAECVVVSDEPDGVNINCDCGSTHIGRLQQLVRDNGCDCGFAFDGDADRCLAVDGEGELVDGDKLIAIAALDLKSRSKLRRNRAVVTVMSNLGFFRFAKENGIDVSTTKVGDRYVLEELLRGDYSVGGEQSGHIIFTDYATTGDGQLSAIQTLAAVKRAGRSLHELAQVMTVYPQVLLNVTVSAAKKAGWETDSSIAAAIDKVRSDLGDSGRVLVRASGTEPLIRVMLEGEDIKTTEIQARLIADVICERLDGKY